MPQLGSGPSGYNDYQRDANWDSTSLYGLHRPPSAGIDDSPIIPVTRYACIGLYASVNTNPVICQFQWSADALGVSPLGQYTFVMSPLIANPLQMMFPNLGPYVSFSRQGIAAASWGGEGELFATNRQHQVPIYPQNPVIIDQQATALGANGSVDVFPTDYWSGPMSVFFACAQITNLTLYRLTSGGLFDAVWQMNNVAANVAINPIVNAPVGTWKLTVFNTTAIATIFYLSATPSITGSS